MKRRSGFLIVFAAAAVTFASLMVFAGPEYFNKRNTMHSCHQSRERHNDNKDKNNPGTLKQNN